MSHPMFTITPATAYRLGLIADHIEHHQSGFDYGSFINVPDMSLESARLVETDCGTTGCVAAHAVCVALDDKFIFEDGGSNFIDGAAEEYLLSSGCDDIFPEALFYGWLIEGGLEASPEAVVAALREMSAGTHHRVYIGSVFEKVPMPS